MGGIKDLDRFRRRGRRRGSGLLGSLGFGGGRGRCLLGEMVSDSIRYCAVGRGLGGWRITHVSIAVGGRGHILVGFFDQHRGELIPGSRS